VSAERPPSAAVSRTARLGEQHLARAALTYLAEPGDPALGALLEISDPAEVLAAIRAGTLPGAGPRPGDSPARRRALEAALSRWRLRLPWLPDDGQVEAACRDGIRLVCPADPEWPGGLDELGPARPYALWLRGQADLRLACLRSVSMVGARAATGYGAHMAGEIAADLGERGWVIVSGGAYGIDAAAHRGALVTGGVTIAVLACGVDYAYPAGHAGLFTDIAAHGLVLSEWPPGRHPARLRFLVRNRTIAAYLRHRDRGGKRAQRGTEHRSPRGPARQAADGRARAGDLGAVRRVPPDHQGVGRHLRHPRRRHHRDALTPRLPRPTLRPGPGGHCLGVLRPGPGGHCLGVLRPGPGGHCLGVST
jgi:DNA protecting protein DprA